MLVIDGQQRLTTVTLLLAALAKFVGESESVAGFSAKKLRNYYLLNPLETGERHFKLLLSETDQETLKAIVTDAHPPQEESKHISQNFELFERKIASSEDELVAIWKGLEKLMVVDIALDREHDDPQLIYESMNATGLKLSQADLIRNYVLMGLEKQQQTDLYKQFWRPVEEAFGDRDWFDWFVRGYLVGSE